MPLTLTYSIQPKSEMVSATPNPNPKTLKKAYHIGGIPVEFPYQPYGSQLALMGRVISTLDRAKREGHCHALLESPTGTGKSLSLLCSSLAWQQNYKTKNQYGNLCHSKPALEAFTDPLTFGGGFVPEMEPSGHLASENMEAAQSMVINKEQKKKIMPTIFYSSRTHTQISQVIREYRKTSYRVPMAVLASRKHYCTNAHLRGKENVDEECKMLLKDRDVGCVEFKNMHKVKAHPSLQKGGCHEAHDIEDLVKVGQVVKGCSYYAARSMAEDAQLVFCPYSYVINPVIRGAMEVDIKGAILILDEAHNIEDIARDAGSVDVEEETLLKLQMELAELCSLDAIVYQPLYDMTQDLISWIQQKKSTLEKREFQHYCSCWTGDKALGELQQANISQQYFPILLECAIRAIKAATDKEVEVAHLSGMSVITLEGLFSSLTYFFSRNGSHKFDYQLALQRYVKRDGGNALGEWTHTLSLWCLNPAVVFRDIAELSLSVILTSGTLSPMNSFSSELGVQFGTCLEAPHVADVESQVWAAIISNGPGNCPLNASYKTADGYAFQDELGKSLEEICKIVPAGALVFFPSYKLMEKLCNRWRETGQWSQLNARKSLYVEPRAGNQDDFECLLKGYYNSIRRGNKPAFGRKRRTKKMDLNNSNAVESLENSKKEGAAFLAVYRGKVSEGIDFSDDNARVVIVVGIPFPNIHDIQVSLKKKYNDTYRSSKNLLSGNEWYCQQAFRALNQAAGRCIRHKFDYGAIILLDQRYQEERNRACISKWLRKSIRQYDSYETSLDGLRSFFKDVKDRVGSKMVNVSHNSDSNAENIPSKNPSKRFTGKENQKRNMHDHCGDEVASVTKYGATFPQLNSQDVEVQASVRTNEDSSNCKEYIDLECGSLKDWRRSSIDDPEIYLVKETPGMDGGLNTPSPGSFSKDGNSSSTIVQASTEFPEQLSFQSMSFTNISGTPSRTQCLMDVTPEKNVHANTCSLMPDVESSLNMSVNSHIQKRRKSTGSPFIDLTQGQPDACVADIPSCTSLMRSSIGSRDANRKIEFGVETNCVEHRSKKSNVPQMLPTANCTGSSMSSGFIMDKRLKIFCSLCKSPLGLPQNHLYVDCSLTSSSKVHVAFLLKEELESQSVNTSTSVPVVITDISKVDQLLCNQTHEGAAGQGIWCEEDGCVFNTVFCPFCSTPRNCLGVRIMATDASNVQLLNKVLFYLDHLEISNPEVSKKQDLSPESGSGMDRIAVLDSIEKFSYSPQLQNSGGWRTTKSKLRLPKKGPFSTPDG